MSENPRKIQKKDLIKIYTEDGFSIDEASAEVDFAIEIVAGLTRKDLIIGIMPSPDDILKLKKIIQRRVQTRKPLAQILGFAFFMGDRFEVTADTLIPRPETELLVRKAVEVIKQYGLGQVLDIGTGSGCIACEIAKHSPAQVLGVDISNEALKIALNNAMHMDLMNRALFRKSDLFTKIREEEKFDLILSNPPYIPPQERANLQIEVRDYEPATALFTFDHFGIEFYEKITQQAKTYLNKGGWLMFELGVGQACFVKKLLEENGFTEIEVLKDVSGIERVISGRL